MGLFKFDDLLDCAVEIAVKVNTLFKADPLSQTAAAIAIVAAIFSTIFLSLRWLRGRLHKRQLPVGFLPLDKSKSDTLRSFQSSKKLKYFGWKEYSKSLGKKAYKSESSEEYTNQIKLFKDILKDDRPWLFYGGGGTGKTRIALECARYAQKKKWQIAVMQRDTQLEQAQELVTKTIKSRLKTLIFVDYAEEFTSKVDLGSFVNEIVASDGRVKLVASCRETFLTTESGLPKPWTKKFRLWNMSRNVESAYDQFLRDWNLAACQEICDTEDVINPAVAVILKYASSRPHLRGLERTTSIEADVATMLFKSITNYSPNLKIELKDLVEVLQQFPATENHMKKLLQRETQSLIYRALSKDGWMHTTGRHTELGHDLLVQYPFLAVLDKEDPNLISHEFESLANAAARDDAGAGFLRMIYLASETIGRHLPAKAQSAILKSAALSVGQFTNFPKRVTSMLDASYHSLSLSPLNKFQVLAAVRTLSATQINELEEIFLNERNRFVSMIQNGSAKNIDVLTAAFGSCGGNPEWLNAVISQMGLAISMDDQLNAFAKFRLNDRDWVAFKLAYSPFSDDLNINDLLIERHHRSDNPFIKQECASAMFNKGFRLGAKDEHDAAITAYDAVIERYGSSEDTTIMQLCASAMADKGFRLGAKDEHDAAITAFDAVIERYGSSNISGIQEIVFDSTANSIEMLMLLKRQDVAIERAEYVESRSQIDNEIRTIMPFMRWVCRDDRITPMSLYNLCAELHGSITYTWGFDEIKPLLSEMTEDRQQIAISFMAYFEGEISLPLLRRRLD